MDYLSRESAPFSEALWNKINDTIINSARKHLVGRKFLDIYGPLGAGVSSIVYDKGTAFEEEKTVS